MLDGTDHREATATFTFITRLQALPAVQDALAMATRLYHTTKDYKCVGVVVGVAEGGVRAAAAVLPLATPLTKPILQRVGGWEAVDEWACRGLNTVEEWVPVLRKSPREVTEQVVTSTKEKVLSVVAGTDTVPPPTLTAALTARISHTVSVVSETRGGRTVVWVTEEVLAKAHTLVDHYMAPNACDLHDSDGREGGVVVKASTLGQKTIRRLYRITHDFVHPNSEDCNDTSATHLVARAGESAREWYATTTQDQRLQVEGMSMVQISVRLAVRTTHHLVLSVRFFLDLSPSQVTNMVLNYSAGVAERTTMLMNLLMQQLKVFFIILELYALRFRLKSIQLKDL
ncbi:uncharacterized protein LOC121868966 [Homarus americanus]|uniref:Perilipin-2-like 1 n=1 Tax=Homarus americanus TaxID=6706 RepID=A0A8J5TKQ0_HOMAM|nr:uncharacterized protein LOC121868966 [Homarus americanus]KAG7177121.1 Perilipin-2-like 1 [Homarus americanus]